MSTMRFPWMGQAASGPKGGRFRCGQWVRFRASSPIAGAHVTSDGYTVGIYRPGRAQSPVMVGDGQGKRRAPVYSHERVVVVTPSGGNLPWVDETGQVHAALWLPPEACPHLEAVTRREDIPAARIADNPDWQPEP